MLARERQPQEARHWQQCYLELSRDLIAQSSLPPEYIGLPLQQHWGLA